MVSLLFINLVIHCHRLALLIFMSSQHRAAVTNLTDKNRHLTTQVEAQANNMTTKDSAMDTMKKYHSTTPGVNQDPEVETSRSEHKESQPLKLQEGKLVEQQILLEPWGFLKRQRHMFQESRWPQRQSNILEQDGRKYERYPRGRVTVRDQYN